MDIRRSLHPLRIRYAAPALGRVREFWAWWSGEIFAILPAGVRDAIAQRSQKLFIETDGQALRLSLGSWGSRQGAGQAPLTASADAPERLPRDAQQTIVLMPEGKVLTRPLVLPLAAEENLREVLGFEMDQHTPFQVDKVYYDFVVTGRDTERQELLVDLVYSPRSEVDPLLEAVAGHDLDVDIVTSRDRDGSNLRSINLLPQEVRKRRRVSPRRINVALAALCVLLLLVAIAVPVAQKNEALVLLEEQVQAAATEAREGNQVRKGLENMAEASRFLFEKKREDLLAVQLIEEVSTILPDHTWLARLDISATEMQMQGQSTASSSLIAIIEASPLFENANFRSPVVQVQGTDSDRFHLSADIVRSGEQ